jgi:hypothetical protein
LPTFTGERNLTAVTNFLTDIERFFQLRNLKLGRTSLDTSGWAAQAVLQLRDNAATWARHAIPVSTAANMCWETFEKAVKSEYQPIDAVDTLRAYWRNLNITHNGPVAIFNDTFRQLRSELQPHSPITEQQALEAYLDKLSNNAFAKCSVQQQIALAKRMNQTLDLPEAMQIAADADNTMYRRTSTAAKKALTTLEMYAMFTGGERKQGFGKKKDETGTGKDKKDSDKTRASTFGPAFDANGSPRCFNCNEYGHISKNCDKPRRLRKSMRNIETGAPVKQIEQGTNEVSLGGKVTEISEEGKE